MNSPIDPNTPTPTVSPTTPPQSAPSNTKAVIALVLGILSLVCCGFFTGIPAIFLGRSELKDIDQGRSIEANRTIAKLGFILGIVGTALSCLGTLAYIAIIGFAVFTGTQQTPATF